MIVNDTLNAWLLENYRVPIYIFGFIVGIVCLFAVFSMMHMNKEPVQVAELLEMQQVLDEKILKEHESCSGCPLCVETYDCELIECSVEPRDWNLELKEKIELD